LLDVSRVSSGKIALHRQLVDVPELITRCIATMTANSRHEISVRTQPVIVDADSMRLEQIVMNLLTNAVKYTPRGGSINVTAGRDGDTALIVVEDTGVGMTADLVERVFELFVQGERSPARSEGGLGIGLTLVKRLVEMHGGSVDATSAGLGRGSRFTVKDRFLTVTTIATRRRSGSSRSFDVLREQFVDERLVTQPSPLGFPPHGGENVRIDPNRDQSPRPGAQWRPSYPSHRSELRGRGLPDIGEVNPPTPTRMPRALCGSPGAR
jgi:Histidine kinase-, DNA gyrase B-, and HSP90-like ATPase